jgi:RNA ligase
MVLFDYVDRDKLAQQITDGMVKENAHSALPLRILNYTPKAQFTPELWNEVTDKCRGLIYDANTNRIVARPFVKFWNYQDARHPETLPENFPLSVPSITRKYDGSLGIIYRYEGEWGVATRGSFTSEQAVWATKWLHRRSSFLWPIDFTPLVEIIFPENQIVVKYEWSGLVALASVNVDTGEEASRSTLEEWAAANEMRVVEKFEKSLDVCTKEDIENEEGYVVSWERPNTWPLRVKVKMDTYCRLHRLLTQTNPVTVWEMMRDGLDLGTVKTDVPADFIEWVNMVESQLLSAYRTIENSACAAMLEYGGEKIISTPEHRKLFALYAATKHPVTPILFAMLDGKDYAPIIWKMIKPKANDTFKVDTDL